MKHADPPDPETSAELLDLLADAVDNDEARERFIRSYEDTRHLWPLGKGGALEDQCNEYLDLLNLARCAWPPRENTPEEKARMEELDAALLAAVREFAAEMWDHLPESVRQMNRRKRT